MNNRCGTKEFLCVQQYRREINQSECLNNPETKFQKCKSPTKIHTKQKVGKERNDNSLREKYGRKKLQISKTSLRAKGGQTLTLSPWKACAQESLQCNLGNCCTRDKMVGARSDGGIAESVNLTNTLETEDIKTVFYLLFSSNPPLSHRSSIYIQHTYICLRAHEQLWNSNLTSFDFRLSLVSFVSWFLIGR